MRANPDGPGWMHYAIRKNAEMPEVVTDSYLHSMMMAIIVAGARDDGACLGQRDEVAAFGPGDMGRGSAPTRR